MCLGCGTEPAASFQTSEVDLGPPASLVTVAVCMLVLPAACSVVVILPAGSVVACWCLATSSESGIGGFCGSGFRANETAVPYLLPSLTIVN